MDFVVPDNRTAVSPDLNPCQGIPIYVVSFNKAPAITKYVNTTLVAIKDRVTPAIWYEEIKINKMNDKLTEKKNNKYLKKVTILKQPGE